MKTALLIVDMQRQFENVFQRLVDFERVVEHINHVSGVLRASGHPVIHVIDVEGIHPDAPGADELPL